MDGPPMAVEFARISADGRLTLVIHPGSPAQRTYWAESQLTDLGEARENLRAREGTRLEFISTTSADVARDSAADAAAIKVYDWLSSQLHALKAAVWTGLKSNWFDRRGTEFTPESALKYLQELEGETADKAREYISCTPSQIQTPLRSRIRQELHWDDAELPPGLFEMSDTKRT